MLVCDIKLRGKSHDDIQRALLEVSRLVNEGYKMGKDKNESGDYSFDTKLEEKVQNVWLPKDMDIPVHRRNTTVRANVEWLLRNLAIRNSDHPLCGQTIESLNKAMEKM